MSAANKAQLSGANVGGPARILRTAIRAYQGLSWRRAAVCRFWPTCSNYAIEAIEIHGVGRGFLLAVRRLTRCHPWGAYGVDPVPIFSRHQPRSIR